MKTEQILDCERNRLNKISSFRLPYSFKKTGIVVFTLSFIALMSKIFISDDTEMISEISKKGLLIGMLLISISKDKLEDELTVKLRAQSYTVAFIVGVIYTIVMPYVDYLVSNSINAESEKLKDLGDFQILFFILMIQLAFYYAFKKAYK
ncbi:MAG: hypothetical protein L3J14_08575 [Flavobacteriaceae bacterium]|nr:hypothetical protein [Flavobacteriaceae bacterium]